MRWDRVDVWLAVGIGLGMMSAAMAEDPSVVSPEDLNAARALERNTYHDDQFGFSITKPEEWVWYTDLAGSESLGLSLVEDVSTKLRAVPIVITRFPVEAKWVLVNPRVSVQVYEITERVPPEGESQVLDSIQQQFLLQAQADPKAAAQVLFPPTVVEIHGVPWRKFGTSAKLSTSAGGKLVDCYTGTYLARRQNYCFLVSFLARMVDVPVYRKEVDRIIGSIVLTVQGEKKDEPGTKTRL